MSVIVWNRDDNPAKYALDFIAAVVPEHILHTHAHAHK